jgi:hypothetical protein
MAVPAYVDRDLLATALYLGGLSPEEIARQLEQSNGDANLALSIMSRAGNERERAVAKAVGDYLSTLGTESLQKLLVVGGVSEDLAIRSINTAQGGRTATPTLRAVTGELARGGDPRYADAVGTLRSVGIGESAFDTTRTQYKEGRRPAPVAPPAAPGPAGRSSGGLLPNVPVAMATPGAPAPRPGPAGGAAAAKRSGGGTPGGTLGGTLGGGGGGGGGGGTPAPLLAPNASDPEVEKYIRKNYGFSAWALAIPDIRGAMIDVARTLRGATVDEATIESLLESRLLGTEWWNTHDATQRLRIEEQHEDRATYNAGVEGEYKKVNFLLGQLGFTVPEGRLREIARQSYDFGWEQAEQRAALAAEFDYDPTTGAQDQSRIVGDLRGLASDYLVPLSEQTIDQWGRQIIAGTARSEDFTEYAKGIAKGMFAHYASDIDAGRTVRQIADSFVQTAARDLELTPDQIDLMDPRWRKALELDPATGQPMQLSTWQRTIRSDSSYGWDRTDNARKEASEFSRKILETFGAVG